MKNEYFQVMNGFKQTSWWNEVGPLHETNQDAIEWLLYAVEMVKIRSKWAAPDYKIELVQKP
jgi:hypothetical protein